MQSGPPSSIFSRPVALCRDNQGKIYRSEGPEWEHISHGSGQCSPNGLTRSDVIVVTASAGGPKQTGILFHPNFYGSLRSSALIPRPGRC